MSGSAPRSAVVAGAGIVGIATACWLQTGGWKVTLVDPAEPAEAGASAGNAGLIAVHIARPIGMPGIWRQVPRMLLDPAGPVSVDPRYIPRIAPWLLRLLFASRAGRVQQIGGALKTLLDRAWSGLEPLVEAADAGDLVRRRGVLVAYHGEAERRAARVEHDLLERVGVRLEHLTGQELREQIPAIGARYDAAVLFPDSGHTLDPLQLAKRLFAGFVKRGGRFRRAPLDGFRTSDGRIVSVSVGGEEVRADVYACCAGVWSAELCRMLGYRVPLDAERGYHLTLPNPGVSVEVPVILADAKLAVTPMASGLRVAGTIEFAARHSPPRPARFDALLAGARRAFDGLRADGATRWMGLRPSLPDSLPVIGRAPRHRNLLLGFGHGHLGLTLSGATGRLLADLAAGSEPSCDLGPYRLDRFGLGARA